MASAFWYQKMAEQYYLYIKLTDLCVKDSDIFWYQNYSAKLERGPQNLNKRDTQKRMRKLPQQIKNAPINLIAETHQVWYALDIDGVMF